MRTKHNRRFGFNHLVRNRQMALVAAATLAMANMALAQSQTLYFDLNGASTGYGAAGSGIWDESTTADWNTISGNSTTNPPGTWNQGGDDYNIAEFQLAGMLAYVSGTVDLGGITWVSGQGGTTTSYEANTEANFNVGPNGVVLNNITTTSKDLIYTPWTGSGNITFEYGSTANMTLLGDMTGFTGNIYVVNNATGAGVRTGTAPTNNGLQIASNTGGGTIYLDNGSSVGADNVLNYTPLNGTAMSTPYNFTLSSPIVLNYGGTSNSPVANGASYIYASNGADSLTGVAPGTTTDNNPNLIGQSDASYTLGTAITMTFGGVISSPAGVTSNLVIGSNAAAGGDRGVVVLGAQNTYTGATVINETGNNGSSSAGNGLVVLGVDNAIPSTSEVVFGLGTPSTNTKSTGQVAPLDLNGHSVSVLGLVTNTSTTTSNADGISNGNIYNTALISSNNYASPLQQVGSPNTATITVNGPGNFTYSGDIGDTNDVVAPYYNQQPYIVDSGGTYQSNVNFGTNINLTINGGNQTLSPNGQPKGDEYSGTTTINSGGTLTLGRTTGYTAGNQPTSPTYTLTGGGNVNVNAGGTLASVATTFGTSPTYAGGAQGTINLNGTLNIGGTSTGGTTGMGTFAVNNINVNDGSSMNFDIASPTTYDNLYVDGTLTLDSGTHYINVNIPSGDSLAPATYTLIAAGNNYFNITGSSDGFVLNPVTGLTGTETQDTFQLIDNNLDLLLRVSGPALQWDPDSTGPSTGIVQEDSGIWQEGSPFYYSLGGVDQGWTNGETTLPVYIGNSSPTQNGGTITLGQNIDVGAQLIFGPVNVNAGYDIVNASGNNYTLELDAGLDAFTTAGTSYGAEIDTPVVLGASQTWEIDSGSSLLVTNSVTELNGTTVDTLTKTGSGLLTIKSTNGSIGTLDVEAGTVLLYGTGSLGNANYILNSALEFESGGTFTNNITVGSSNNGEIGTVSGTLMLAQNLNSTYELSLFGSGNTDLTGNNTLGTLRVAGSGTDAVTGTNDFGAITIAGGTLVVTNQAQIGGNGTTLPTITFTGAPQGGLNVVAMTTLANNLSGTGSGAGAGGNSFGDAVYFDETNPLTISGSTGGTGDIRFNGVTGGSGTAPTPQITFSGASTRPSGGALYYNADNMEIVITNPLAMGLSTQAFMQDANGYDNYTIDVDGSLIATSGDLRGEGATGGVAFNTTTGFTLTKIGTGLLSTSGSAGSGYNGTINVDQGELAETSTTGVGGTAGAIMAINVNGPTAVFGADFSNATRTGDSFTLSNGGTLRRDNVAYTETITSGVGTIASAGFSGETDIVAASAADVITISGTGGTIEDAAQEASSANSAITNTLFTITNPVVVDTGATLNLQNDNTGGYDNGYLWAFRGPTATTNDYDTLTVQAGATVTTDNGPGQIRFGRTNSQGVPIIAQGTPGSESTLKLGVAGGNDDVYMTTNNGTSGEYNTIFVVEGTGTAGLRIEAPMDATYEDVTAAGVTPQTPEGTTGLFGLNTTVTAGTLPTGLASGFYGVISNAYTVMSPARTTALSSYTYTDANGNVQTIMPSGTLTLAANDQTSVSGTMLGGPGGSTVTNLSLAFDNTAPQSGSLTGVTYTYVINPAANSAGGTFANFAGLTVERTYSAGASVIAQLQINSGMTKIPSLSITGDAMVDITNQGLAVDPATGPAPTAQILQYLKNSYDNGAWDLPGGIGSSQVSAVPGTSIGYAENDLLPTPYTDFGGQTVDNNAVLVRFTWLGDLNLDGVVNATDLAMMSSSGTTWATGDLNYDGKVNADDWSLFFLGDAEQTGQLPLAVPEPAAASLLIAGAGMLLRRRRRS